MFSIYRARGLSNREMFARGLVPWPPSESAQLPSSSVLFSVDISRFAEWDVEAG